jgi:hypothetical protein
MRTRTIDLERWRQLDLIDQMANIGAEVGRTFNARQQGDSDRYWGAIERAVDLFEATVLTEKDRQPYRLKEVMRAKEEYLRIASAEEFDEADAARLERYFMDFALMSLARRERVPS